MALRVDHDIVYNFSTTEFVVISEITNEVLERAIKRYEEHWYAELTAQFSRVGGAEGVPLLFVFSGASFRYVKHARVASLLDAPLSTKAPELVDLIKASGRADTLAETILGGTLGSALDALTPHTLKHHILFDDVRAFYQEWLQSEGSAAPLKFMELLTDFERSGKAGIRLANVYALLIALYSEGVVLHPLGVWRGIYKDSGAGTSQKFMDGKMSQSLLSPGASRDYRHISRLVDAVSSAKPQLLRHLQCLLLTTRVRLAELDPDAVLETVNNYLTNEEFRKRKHSNRRDTREVAAKAMRLLSGFLIECGVPDGIKLGHPKALVDGFMARKVAEGKAGGDFALLADKGFTGWSELLSEYVRSAPVSRKKSVIDPIMPFLDWLTKHGSDLASPEEMIRADVVRLPTSHRIKTVNEYLAERYGPTSARAATTFSQTRLFLEWYRREKNEEYRVPFLLDDQPRQPEYLGKTVKEALPARVIEVMKQVLTENDWAWAKQFQVDVLSLKNHKTGAVETVWCPVRAKALYLMLWVPIRAIQVRLLDSGEFDEYQLDGETRSFISNERGIKGRRLGVFREYNDPRSSGGRFVGLFINTNKTQRIYSASKRQGYEIQWEREEVLRTLVEMREWQETYNPLTAPIHVNALEDSNLHAPDNISKLIPEYAFLFRDAASRRASPWEPVSYQRLNVLFMELCAETERRLQATGMPVKLIEKWDVRADGKEVPEVASVTLHSLRVSGITNFAEFGCPLNVITEFLAGHSTILMNIWYQKFGFSTISSIIDRASNAVMTAEGLHQLQKWIDDQAENSAADDANIAEGDAGEDFLGAHPLDQLFMGGSRDALDSLQRQAAGLWHVDIDGICPNGRTLCHEGGERIGTKGYTRNTPVPRGSCPQCRHWVTGPMFVFGQIVKANVLLYHIQEEGQVISKLQDELDTLQKADSLNKNNERRIAEVRASIQVHENQVENALQIWVKRYEYAVRSVSLLREDGLAAEGSDQPHRLLTATTNPAFNGEKALLANSSPEAPEQASDEESIRLSLMETHPLALMEFAAQACEVIPGIEVAAARLKKNKLLDMMLDREGKSPLFFKLSDDDALRAGNALTRFLASIVDQQGVSRLLAGETNLTELGLVDAFDRGLEVAFEKAGIALPGKKAVNDVDDLLLEGYGHA